MLSIRVLAALIGAALLAACSKIPVQVQVANGNLQGYVKQEVEHYLGIPYARPPVGALRWRPPQPMPPWEGTLPVQHNPANCLQWVPFLNDLAGQEDCLYLNVWTPVNKPSESMPVMVWIHGGGFIVGAGSYRDSDGLRLARQKEVVVVSLNYRLGVFGFLAHHALTEEDPAHPTSGNYGIEDQTAALRWVRDNIRAFGGDPDNITIFGQSAGGVSVCAQLISPQAAGLFQRAVIQSGPCATPMSSLAAVDHLGEALSYATACESAPDMLVCLRALPAEEVATVLPADPSFGFGEDYTLWWPVLDGHVLPRQFMDGFESGEFNRVPLMVGATRDEASLLIWLSHNLRFKSLQAEQYLQRLEYLTGNPALAQAVAERYPLSAYDSPFEALTEAFSDGFFNCASRWQTQALSRHVPTWSYQFNYERAPFFIPWADLKAFHSAEIQYIFNNRMSLLRRDFSHEESQLSDSMMGYWVQFARAGNPNAPGFSPWPRYDSADQTLLFDLENRVARGVHREACEFWRNLSYLRPPYR